MEKIPDRILRRMGFRDECQGLIDRYIGVEGAWDDHLCRTRNFIANAVAGKRFDNLAVLGSGWLLDLPLDELVEVSGHVWLYDAMHPTQVMHKLRRYTNVTPVSADITGGCMVNAWQAVKLYGRTGERTAPEEICNKDFQPDPVPDFVISLNLLSQIGGMITGYLLQHIPYTREEIHRIHSLLQQAHLELLPHGRSCMVTDICEINTDFSSGISEISDLLSVILPEAPHNQTWEWQFDPNGSYKEGKKTVLKVIAQEL